jgi:hypothetical protein
MADHRDYSHAYTWLDHARWHVDEDSFVAACLATPGLPQHGIALKQSLADCCRALHASQLVLGTQEWTQRCAEAIARYREGTLAFRRTPG